MVGCQGACKLGLFCKELEPPTDPEDTLQSMLLAPSYSLGYRVPWQLCDLGCCGQSLQASAM